MTTESWLNAKAAPAERGRVFALYMVGTFVGLALGQLLIGRIEIETSMPFDLISVLFALALVMVCATRSAPPQTLAVVPLAFGQLTRTAPVAVIGAMLSGFTTSIFYALVPAWAQGAGVERWRIGLFMLAAVLGGLLFQVPVGRLSDRFDRRVVLTALGIGVAVAAFGLIHLPRNLTLILAAAVLLGGFQSTLYPVCVAHAHDRIPADRVIAVSGRLLLLSGIGSVLGPIIGTGVMQRFAIDGVFYLMAAAAVVLAAIAARRSLSVRPPQHQDRPFDILAPQATPLAHDPLGAGNQTPAPQQA